MMDIVDHCITRAVMHYSDQQPKIDVEKGLSDEQVASTSDFQERFNLVMAHYLAGAISLGRAAELLELSWLDLRTRFLRLDVPVRTAPIDLHEARLDIEGAVAHSGLVHPIRVFPADRLDALTGLVEIGGDALADSEALYDLDRG